jgi:hypothetical protein
MRAEFYNELAVWIGIVLSAMRVPFNIRCAVLMATLETCWLSATCGHPWRAAGRLGNSGLAQSLQKTGTACMHLHGAGQLWVELGCAGDAEGGQDMGCDADGGANTMFWMH